MQDILNVWGGGQLMAFSALDGKTDFDHGIVLRTAFDGFAIECKLPRDDAKIRFSDAPPVKTYLAGDHFQCTSDQGEVTGVLTDAYHLLIEGPCRVESLNGAFEHEVRGNRTLIGSRGFFNPAWLDADINDIFAQRRKWLDKHCANLPSRATAKALSQLKTQCYSAEGQLRHNFTTPDRWPHKMAWLWDTVFHALGLRHFEPQFARDSINAVFDSQQPNGFIPLGMSPYYSSRVTQPPVLGFGIKMMMQTHPDPAWERELYPKLGSFAKWIMANRDSDGAGLVEWHIEQYKHCRSGESGMDNSSRFDGAIQLDAPDFNAFLALDCEVLADMATRHGTPEEVKYWQDHHQRLCRLINERLWDPEKKFYFDYDVKTDQRLDVMASSGFLPLLCGAATPEQARELRDHLYNPETFHTPLRVPSIARCCEKYYSKDMWRGPVWINVNHMIACGLERYGFTAESEELLRETMTEQERFYEKYGVFFEFYDDRREIDPPQLLRKHDPTSTEPSAFHQVFFDYGWSATLYLDMICR